MPSMLVDTDVLIWHLRGYPQATRRLDQLASLTMSAVSYLEVLQGMRNRAELVAVKMMLERRHATLLPITAAITQLRSQPCSPRLCQGLRWRAQGQRRQCRCAADASWTLLLRGISRRSSTPSLRDHTAITQRLDGAQLRGHEVRALWHLQLATGA